MEKRNRQFQIKHLQKGLVKMTKNLKIYRDTVVEDLVVGEKTRILFTEHRLNKNDDYMGLNLYAIVKKGDHHMVDDINTSNVEDFVGSVLSYKHLTLGSDVNVITDTCWKMESIENYHTETIGKIALFVICPMHGLEKGEIINKLNAVKAAFAIAYDRNPEDVELLDQVNVVDSFDVDSNFKNEKERRIYRLTRSMRMLSKATHVVDASRFSRYEFAPYPMAKGCNVEIELCRQYDIDMIDITTIAAKVKEKGNTNENILGAIFGEPKKDNKIKGKYGGTPIPFPRNIDNCGSLMNDYSPFSEQDLFSSTALRF